jgi:DNA mismatch repair protein MutL
MSQIRILPDILSNKIAAGEVVERPASVVKELAENALDAGASRILIDVEQGGRSLIRVADNGSGMSRDDALLSIERHATSKIASDEDLFNIRTLGFRGEALPSIAAVSKFSLVTRDAASEAGTVIRIEGGKLVNVAEAGAPAGTLVEVRQLFFNTPARRKFLKSVATEMAHIADILSGMALAWPQVQFRLTHNERILKNWPAATDAFERAVEVLGGGLRDDLHAIARSREGHSVSGWVSSPRVRRTSSNGIFILVNRRWVRDRVVQHALFQGYSQRLVKGQFPLAVLFLTAAADQVDVNVHPAKNEVRFSRSQEVHELIRQAVAQTLYDVDRPNWKPIGFEEAVRTDGGVAEGGLEFGRGKAEGGGEKGEDGRGACRAEAFGEGGKAEDHRGGTPLPHKIQPSEGGASSPDDRGQRPACASHPARPLPQRSRDAAPTAQQELPHTSASFVGEASSLDHRGKMPLPQPAEDAGVSSSPSPSAFSLQPSASLPQPSAFRLQTEIWEQRGFAGMRVIGQLHDTYIVCEAGDGLILIDQHAAHERVLYDQICRRAGSLAQASQALLVPDTIDLSFREVQAIEVLMAQLHEIGIVVEPFGGDTLVVKAVPGFLSGRDMRPFLTEIAEAAASLESPSTPGDVFDFCRQRAACHGAIRAGQKLVMAQMEALLRQMDECANFSHCPHGRPTWVKWDAGTIERLFKRT